MTNNFKEKNILIVEDNVVNQKVIAKLVKIFGHIPHIISDGIIAFDFVKENKPDLILMDIQLVEISGIEITRRIKNDPEISSIPVIVVTASATPEERHKIISESFCDEYVAKPFSPNELAEKISKYFPVLKTNF